MHLQFYATPQLLEELAAANSDAERNVLLENFVAEFKLPVTMRCFAGGAWRS
jgi:hypothetical protein